MSKNAVEILLVKGLIAELPPEQAEAAHDLAGHLRLVLKQAGEPVNQLALSLVGLEMLDAAE